VHRDDGGVQQIERPRRAARLDLQEVDAVALEPIQSGSGVVDGSGSGGGGNLWMWHVSDLIPLSGKLEKKVPPTPASPFAQRSR